MKIKRFPILNLALSILCAVSLAACTVPGGTTGPAASAGSVQMWVTDAPRTDNVSEIWVTVSKVQIHKAGSDASGNTSNNTVGNTSGNVTDNTTGNVTGNSSEGLEDNGTENASDWITVNITGANRFDLLVLKGDGNGGGLQQILASANLTPGRYTQIRMTIDKVEVKLNGELKDATVPGGKLKFVHPFEVQSGSMTKLLFDFDADKFITVTGNPSNPRILVKPVVKLIVSPPHAQDTGRVSGSQSGNHTGNKPEDKAGTQNRNQTAAGQAPQGNPGNANPNKRETGNQTENHTADRPEPQTGRGNAQT